MATLSVVSNNSATMPAPLLTRRELRDRRERLGIVVHSGGRMLPVPMSVFEPQHTVDAHVKRHAVTPVSEFVSPGLRPVGPAGSAAPRVHVPMTAHDNYIIDREE
ncbi:hypothetical protein KF728_17360 [Candidatus Obscuribacterales bacterium]|nr:hypothetical protein [Candidatus Obscuribacterales bacterium]